MLGCCGCGGRCGGNSTGGVSSTVAPLPIVAAEPMAAAGAPALGLFGNGAGGCSTAGWLITAGAIVLLMMAGGKR